MKVLWKYCKHNTYFILFLTKLKVKDTILTEINERTKLNKSEVGRLNWILDKIRRYNL